MCLGVPGRIITITPVDDFIRMGSVDFGGVTKEINLSLVPEAAPGGYVLVHAGFAIAVIDEVAAQATLDALNSLEEPIDRDKEPAP